ncbi:MAG TPA: YciI family protein [Pseudonocardia sp.]|nr:YciI family protein [Pseudonocardia sp.]
MPQYLLSIYQPDGPHPDPEQLEGIMRDVAAFKAELKAADAWVFSGGLHDAATATVVRPQDHDFLATDGPYAEGKEHVGGVVVIQASAATTLPIEVRPFQ